MLLNGLLGVRDLEVAQTGLAQTTQEMEAKEADSCSKGTRDRTRKDAKTPDKKPDEAEFEAVART